MNSSLLRAKNIFTCFLIAFVLYIPSKGQFTTQETAERTKSYVKYLASDELEGRMIGEPGNFKAAEYIANFYKSIGLLPVNGTYTQEFPVTTGIKIGPANNVIFNVLVERPGVPKEMWKSTPKKWNVVEDWQPMRISENGTVSGELAFVGYGITAKDLEYDDYEGIDVKGKIVIILADSAEGKPKNAKFGPYSELRYKASNARDHGAAAVIFVKTQSDSANTYYPLRLERMFKNTGVIAIQANRTKIALFFPKNQQLYPTEMEINKKMKPKSFILPNITMNLTVDLQKDEKMVPNVLGMVKGTDPAKADEYIVVGAHFDHLGWGGDNSLYRGKDKQIHNGADDNASGTAGIMELAARIAKKPLRRSVIFIAFNGEEEGLLGSSYYAKNPLIPNNKTIAMLNFDMIGRMKNNSLSVFGTKTSTHFAQIVDSLANLDSLKVSKVAEGYGPSDHASFYAEKVPVLFFFTGLHEDYHKPSDDWDKLNYEGLAHTVEYGELFLRIFGNEETNPDYLKVAAQPKEMGSGDTKGGYGSVWFGIIPNFEENPAGLLISGASAGSPAEKAGLQNGDVITSFGEKAIKNLYDLTYALREKHPGDKVTVKYLRNDKEVVVDVTLVKK